MDGGADAGEGTGLDEHGVPITCYVQGEPDEDTVCDVCMEVMKDPVKLSCDHSFCRVCMDDWKIKQREIKKKKDLSTTGVSCPVCRASQQKDALFQSNSGLATRISMARVRCPFGALVDGASGNMVQDRLGCTEVFAYGDKELLRQHMGVCGHAPVKCKNPQCAMPMKQMDLQAHARVCQYEPVECSFIGCTANIFRKDVHSHNRMYASAHARNEREHREQLALENNCLELLLQEARQAVKTERELRLPLFREMLGRFNVVRVPDDFTTVQEAVDAASPNGLILLRGDQFFFRTRVTIKFKAVNIRGQPGCVIQSGVSGPVFECGEGATVHVEDLKVCQTEDRWWSHQNVGCFVHRGARCHFNKCYFTSASGGGVLVSGKDTKVEMTNSNVSSCNGDGVAVEGGATLETTACTYSCNKGNGIVGLGGNIFCHGSYNVATANAKYGVNLDRVERATVEGTFHGNTEGAVYVPQQCVFGDDRLRLTDVKTEMQTWFLDQESHSLSTDQRAFFSQKMKVACASRHRFACHERTPFLIVGSHRGILEDRYRAGAE